MDEDELDRIFAALADRTRRAMLSHLAEVGEASVNDLAAPFAMSLQAVSKHIKVLESAGLISRTRQAQFRRARLEVGPLTGAIGWIEEHRRLSEERYDRLADHLRRLQATATATTTKEERS